MFKIKSNVKFKEGTSAIYRFLPPFSWTQLGADLDGEAAGDSSGFSVSMNAAGDRVAIGATRNDATGAND